MPFYVRLGPRGLIFRLGTFLIGIIGSAVYRRASRRRGRAMATPAPHLRLRHVSTPHGRGRILGKGDPRDVRPAPN